MVEGSAAQCATTGRAHSVVGEDVWLGLGTHVAVNVSGSASAGVRQ